VDTHTPLGYDPTTTWARHCSACGFIDDSERWKTKDEAEEGGVYEKPWTCPRCGATDFEVALVAKLGGG
jgi:hypothetical protein